VLELFLKRLSTRPSSAIRFGLQPKYFRSYGSVECEPWFTGSREKCELGNNVNHKNIDKIIQGPDRWTKLWKPSIRVNQIYMNQKEMFLMKKVMFSYVFNDRVFPAVITRKFLIIFLSSKIALFIKRPLSVLSVLFRSNS
jgi:hypothetical protein